MDMTGSFLYIYNNYLVTSRGETSVLDTMIEVLSTPDRIDLNYKSVSVSNSGDHQYCRKRRYDRRLNIKGGSVSVVSFCVFKEQNFFNEIR